MGWRWGKWAAHFLGGQHFAAAGLTLLVAAIWLPSCAAADDRASLGLAVSYLTPESAPVFAVPDGKGALVVGVVPGGSAARAGIVAGDVLRILAGRAMIDPDTVVATARSLTVGAKVQVVVRRGGADRKMTMVVGDRMAIDPAQADPTMHERYQQAATAFEANDASRAVPLTRDLAVRGYGPAQNLYGVLISIGMAEGGNPAAASFWYRLAAHQNESAAQNNLALQYAQGAGVPHDNARAYYWISRAAAANNSGALEFLQQLDPVLQPAERAQAQAWLAWAPSQQVATAQPGAPAPALVPTSTGPSRDEIRKAQQELARLGYDVGVADGVAGRKTKAAIRAFQEKAGLPVDGAVSPTLLTALAAASTPANIGAATATTPAPTETPAPGGGLGDLGFPSGDLEIEN